MEPVVFARQPIFNEGLEAVGYELLYRRPRSSSAEFIDGNHATARVVVGALVEVGLNEVVGPLPAFINVTRELLCSDRLFSLPPHRVVLEILENTEIDDELVAAVTRLREEDYHIALDDFTFRPGVERLLPMATYVKLDVMAQGLDGIREQIQDLSHWDLQLLAEKVETREELEACKELGCTLFQGYFLARPSNIQRGGTAPARQTLLRLVARLYDPDVSVREIEHIVSSDVGLSYRILRIINSAYYHLPRKVRSVRQAVALLGLRFTRAWVSLIVMADLGDAPTEIVTAAAVRAKMCERLAQIKGEADPEAYYISGLFSMLDAIMDQPLQDIVGSLPLSTDIKDALMNKDGPIGEALNCVLAHEQAKWESLKFEGLDDSSIQQAYLEALSWAFRTREALWAALTQPQQTTPNAKVE